jgi:hypothetical protein
MYSGGYDSGSQAISDALDRFETRLCNSCRICPHGSVKVVVGQTFRDQHQGIAGVTDHPIREHAGEFNSTRMNRCKVVMRN